MLARNFSEQRFTQAMINIHNPVQRLFYSLLGYILNEPCGSPPSYYQQCRPSTADSDWRATCRTFRTEISLDKCLIWEMKSAYWYLKMNIVVFISTSGRRLADVWPMTYSFLAFYCSQQLWEGPR